MNPASEVECCCHSHPAFPPPALPLWCRRKLWRCGGGRGATCSSRSRTRWRWVLSCRSTLPQAGALCSANCIESPLTALQGPAPARARMLLLTSHSAPDHPPRATVLAPPLALSRPARRCGCSTTLTTPCCTAGSVCGSGGCSATAVGCETGGTRAGMLCGVGGRRDGLCTGAGSSGLPAFQPALGWACS